MNKKSKKYRSACEQVKKQAYPLDQALTLLKSIASAKFDQSIEAHISLGIDPKKSEQIVKGVLNPPHGTGRYVRVAVFTETKQKEAKEAGADLIGGPELIDEIVKTKRTDFDTAVATPDFMRNLAKAAKILGTRGLMPSPKNGSVTDDVKTIVSKLKAGQINYRNDAAGNIHQMIGKISWDNAKITENYQALLTEIRRQKPKGVKGAFIKKITLCSTMSPGIKIEI